MTIWTKWMDLPGVNPLIYATRSTGRPLTMRRPGNSFIRFSKKEAILLQAFAAFTLLMAGLAWLVWLPLPEERVQIALSKIEVKPLHLGIVHITVVVDRLNTEIESAGQTPYRLFLAKELNLDGYDLQFDTTENVSAYECIKLISWFSDLHAYQTPEGIVFDISERADRYLNPSWRKDVRSWLKLRAVALGW